MPEDAKTQSLFTETVWQRIPGRRARNSKQHKSHSQWQGTVGH